MAYLVIENDCGYLPESDPACFKTLRDAKDYARSLKDEWLDTEDHDPVFVWSPLRKITKSDTYGGIVYASLDGTLDRVISIVFSEDVL